MRDRLFTRSYCFILAANFLLFFGFWMVIPVLPFYLKDNFSCPEAIIGLILSIYTVTALVVRPFSGYLMDTFPRKPLYILCYFVCTALLLSYTLAGVLILFIILRALHGFAFGGVTVGGNTVVVDIMPSSRRGEGLGYYGLANNLGLALGPMTGLFLHGAISYDGIFAIAFLVTLWGLVMASLVKAPHKVPAKRPPLSLDRFFLIKGIPAGAALLLLSIPYGATTNFVAMYAGEIGITTPSGFFFTCMAAGMGVSRIFSGRYVDRGYVTESIRFGFVPVIAAFFMLAGCSLLIGWSAPAADALFYLTALLLGVGFGIMFPAYNTLFINLAPNNQRATATSTYLTSWDVGIGIGIVLSGFLADLFNFGTVYLLGAVLCMASMFFFNTKVTPHYHINKVR